MGCDIHMRAEVLKDGKWEMVGEVFEGYNNAKSAEPYDGRNYELFSFLAGVRNRFDIIPISEPKGYPDDISKEVKKELEDDWGSDGHSASYLTLEELINADWKRKIKHGGVVPSEVYEYLKECGEKPKIYSQGISGNNIIQLDEADYKKLSWRDKQGIIKYHVYMWWEDTMKDLAGEFYTKTLKALKKLGEPDKVRIVFCFDN